jgi:hypothetical protein
MCMYNIHTKLLLIQAQYRKLCPIRSSSVCNTSSITRTAIRLTTTKFKSRKLKSKSKSKLLYDRLSVCLGVEHTLELVTRYYFLLERWCLKTAILFLWGSLSEKRTGLQFAVQSLHHTYCLIWDSPILEDQVHLFISPRKKVALGSIYVFSFDSQSYDGVELNCYDRRSVSLSIVVSGTPLWPMARFFFSFLSLDNCFALRLWAPCLKRGRVCNL